MNQSFKPAGYNSASPYFIIHGARKFIDLMAAIFDAKELRLYDMPDGSIMHAEIQCSVRRRTNFRLCPW
jgi:PhnB protein